MMRNIHVLVNVGSCRLLSTSSSLSAGRFSRDSAGAKKDLDPATIIENEQKGIFRTLDLNIPKTGFTKHERRDLIRQNRDEVAPPRASTMKPDQDWGAVWPAARTFHPAVVPLPLRQGVVQNKSLVIPSKYANAELMKTANFLHLTPPVIKKHCEAIKKFCTPWPKGLEHEADVDRHFPLEVITSDHLNASSSIRDRRARIVCFKFKLNSLQLDNHARDKFIRLVQTRYEPESDLVTIVVDRCPYRQQNIDYGNYLMTALYSESWITEEWEEKEDIDRETFDWELSRLKETVVRTIGEFDCQPEQIDEKVQEYREVVTNIFNEGEDELAIRAYKNKVQSMLNLNKEVLQPEIISQ